MEIIYEGRHRPAEYQQHPNKNTSPSSMLNNSSTSSSAELQQLVQQSILYGQQQQNNHSLPQTTTPFSLASLNYGPFGLPSFSLSPQNSLNLLHFPQQLQQQQEIERQTAAIAASGAINNGLVSTPNAFEGLPIFVMPNNSSLSLNALQRAAEFKAMAINALIQQQQSQQLTLKIDTSKHFHVFVGDLSQDVDNQMLYDAFSKLGQVSEAKVMRDPQSTKSRSFGFVAYPSKGKFIFKNLQEF
uniref:RRM domain-containing protein n=1 Tax=Meloidogyne floridensis TaxID=298350 RepID=A0A915NHU4_9BILA